MHAADRHQRSERPGQFAHVGVELHPHRARAVDLRVVETIRRIDVAQAGRLTDLVVERNQRKPEPEHDHDNDAQLDEQRPVRLPEMAGLGVAHRRTSRRIATSRKPMIARASTPMPAGGAPAYRTAMTSPKKTTAIESSISAV